MLDTGDLKRQPALQFRQRQCCALLSHRCWKRSSPARGGRLPSLCRSIARCGLRSAAAPADDGPAGYNIPGSPSPRLRHETPWHCRRESFRAARGQATRDSEDPGRPATRSSAEPLGKAPGKERSSRATTGNMKSCHHSRANIDCKRKPWTPDRKPFPLVDHDDVDRGVIDLQQVHRTFGLQGSGRDGAEQFSGSLASLALCGCPSRVERLDPANRRAIVRS